MATDKQPRNNAARKTTNGPTAVPTSAQPVNMAEPTAFTARNAVLEGNESFDLDEVRKRAYELYEEDGRQDGNHEQHWHRAVSEVKGRRRNQQKIA